MENKSKFEEINDILADITYNIVTKQKVNTLEFYKVDIYKENYIEIKVKKEEDKYKILLFGDKWKTIKRSYIEDIEYIEILIALNQIHIQALKMIQDIEQYQSETEDTIN